MRGPRHQFPYASASALGGAVTGTVLAAHHDLAHGLGPALRTSALLLLAATAVVLLEHRDRRGAGTPEAAPAQPAGQVAPDGQKESYAAVNGAVTSEPSGPEERIA